MRRQETGIPFPFDADDQYMDTNGQHKFIKPKFHKGDQRGLVTAISPLPFKDSY